MDVRGVLTDRLDNKRSEDIKWEYKNSNKFIDEDGRFLTDEIAKIIAAFANREGGYLVIGVNDNCLLEGTHYDYKIEIKYITQQPGLSPLNPFEWLAVKSLTDNTLRYDSTIMKYVTHLVEIRF